jgi:nicotinate phosphoribosyltransferase
VRSLLPGVSIFASGDVDEWEIARLKASGACIDGYGLGTRLVTGVPVNGVYKLVEIDGIPVMKESSGKMTYPGRKQIFRHYGETLRGTSLQHDRLGLTTESPQSGEQPLLQLVMQAGKTIPPPAAIAQIRQRTAATVASLPTQCRQLDNPTTVEVQISAALQELTEKTKHQPPRLVAREGRS